MGSIKKGQARARKKALRYHRRSILAISGIILVLFMTITASGMSLKAQNNKYKNQEIDLQNQIAQEDDRSEQIDELQGYVDTDEFVENTAREKLGLAYSDEILFERQ